MGNLKSKGLKVLSKTGGLTRQAPQSGSSADVIGSAQAMQAMSFQGSPALQGVQIPWPEHDKPHTTHLHGRSVSIRLSTKLLNLG